MTVRQGGKLTTWARGPPKRGSPDPQDHPPPSWIRPWIFTLRSGKRVPNNRKRPKEENAILPLCCSPPLLLVAVPHDTHTQTVVRWATGAVGRPRPLSSPPPPSSAAGHVRKCSSQAAKHVRGKECPAQYL